MSPLISILVPVYNAASYLPAFVASLAQQDLTRVEVIFLIDASPDESEAVLRRELARHYIENICRVISLSENQGISYARQKLLEAAQGDYILYADPDDTMDEGMLRTLLLRAQGTQADMVWEDYFLQEGETSQRIQQCASEDTETFLCQLLTGRVHGATWNKFFRKDFLMKHNVSFPRGRVNLCEDICFLVNFLSYRPKIVYSPTGHYHYRMVASSATHRLSQASFESLVCVKDCILPFIKTDAEHAAFLLWQKGIKFSATFSSQVSSGFLKNFLPHCSDVKDLPTSRVMRILYWIAVHFSRKVSLFLYAGLMKVHILLGK